ncbi:MlaD family protein [Dietzia sp. SYD-A1]|uniref:MlaD family protein n=1 Tax=Dietzia sp. SYD-A1 TaxID=2780141 RepID=UPI001E5312F7|nr:MlaD family protein [Dietzia sp. SYD-A1]
MTRLLSTTLARIVALVVVVLLVVAAVWFFTSRSKTISAYFESTRGVYVDDTVRVLGVRVGTITDITTEGGLSKVTMKVDEDVPVPADANALLVAQSLVAERLCSSPRPSPAATRCRTAARFPSSARPSRSSGTGSRTSS